MLFKCKSKADQTNFQSIDLRMWENLGKEHQKAMASLLIAGPKDLILVSECGGRVGTHRLLLALHSSLVADLLLQERKLPFLLLWELNIPEHQGALSALVTGEPKDLVLVSEDGSRVATYGLLLTLH